MATVETGASEPRLAAVAVLDGGLAGGLAGGLDVALPSTPVEAHDLLHDLEDRLELGVERIGPLAVAGAALGLAALLAPIYVPESSAAGLQAVGPLLGVLLIVCSLFGELPQWISWTQRFGSWLYPGVFLGTAFLLAPLLFPAAGHESSFWAFSPRVWLAYLSIVLVSLSFEQSSLPSRVYWFFQTRSLSPAMLVPLYVLVAGLLGNVLDGVSIIAISIVMFRRLLRDEWVVPASFALLFGGLLSNFLTVAAEPTNIKFQDTLAPVLDQVAPSYWLTNWPISVGAILVPVAALAVLMWRGGATWQRHEDQPSTAANDVVPHRAEPWLGLLAICLLAAGITWHTLQHLAMRQSGAIQEPPALGLFLLPAGIAAFGHLWVARSRLPHRHTVHIKLPIRRKTIRHHSRLPATWRHVRLEVPVWLKLAVIFSLLWYVGNGLIETTNVFAAFFTWPEPLRFSAMSILSLASSVTDNVALAAMQGSILLTHPLAIWQIRFLFILLTWAGGFTPFGCLQSLALNSRLELSVGAWLRAAVRWSLLSILGALVGLIAIAMLYPEATDLVR